MAESSPTLRDPAHRVSPRAPYLWLLGASFRSLFVAAVGVVAVLAWGLSIPAWLWVVYVVAAIAYTLVMPQFRYRVHRWETTETAVYTQRGWLSRERRIAPMSRVQTVDFQQTVVSRLFGLATVTVTTASAAGPLQIEDLDADVAQSLVDDLTRRAEADQGDAT